MQKEPRGKSEPEEERQEAEEGTRKRPCQLQLSAKMNQHKSLLQQQFRARGWTCELLGAELQLHVLCNGTGVQSELGLGF